MVIGVRRDMVVVTLDEARDRLSELVDAAARGEIVTITRDGLPIARLEPAWDQARVDQAVERLRMLREETKRGWEARGLPPVTVDEILAWRDEGRR